MTQDQKPPVEQNEIVLLEVRERGAFVSDEKFAALEAELDKCRAENKGWRGLFRRVQEALFGGKARKDDDFDGSFPV